MAPQQKTLPAYYYNDPDRFRQEIDHFYFKKWICVGRTEQLGQPGDYFLCELVGESIIVTRDSQGRVRAFYNVCRHRGTRMCREPHGSFPGRIQCPYHAWTYSLDGRLLGAPHMDGLEFDREEYPLHTVYADVWDGHIFLNMAPDAEPLRAQLADLPDKFSPWGMQELLRYKRITYDVKANWKLIVLNYNECLHCPGLHPLLNRITDYRSGENDLPHLSYIGGSMEFRGGAQTMSMDGTLRREYLPGLTESQRKQVLYYTIYPNLFLSLHPDYMMTHTLWPKAPDLTHVITEWHFRPKEMTKPDFQADDVVNFWDATNKEDWLIAELSQQGISSRAYVPGPYSSSEGLPAAFDRMILEQRQSTKSRKFR